MKNWKFYVILAVIAGAAYLDIPTFKKFFFQDDAAQKTLVAEKYKEISDSFSSLKNLSLYLAESDKNRIRIVGNTKDSFPMESPLIKKLLENKFRYEKTEEGSYLILREPGDTPVTEYANRLNQVSENLRKIQEIHMGEHGKTVVFKMEPNRRIARQTEPIQSMLGEDFDWFYDKGNNRYLSSPAESPYLINLGLDLQGGIYLDVGVQTDQVIEQTLLDLKAELEDVFVEMDTDYDEITRVDDNTLRVDLFDDPELFDTNAELFSLYTQNYTVTKTEESILIKIPEAEVNRIRENSIRRALQTLRNRIDELGVREPSIQRKGVNSIIIELPGQDDPARAKEILTKTASLEFRFVKDNGDPENPGKDAIVLMQETTDPISKEVLSSDPMVVESNVAMRGDLINDARMAIGQLGGAEVQITFSSVGQDVFGNITKENVGRRLAIILDGKIQSAPVIQSPILNGQAVISGQFTPEEATDLAIVLRSGKLPAKLVVNEERTIGASLGEDSIDSSFRSFIIGFAILIALVVIYYKIPGIFGVLSLVLNICLILAALAYFQATLTLPGIAGIILTIGMAIDANVLIYERIKEELQRDTGVKKSIRIGFDRAFTTIFDANFTTLIAGVVLIQFGTGTIKGFANTLTIGILTSMFSAVFFTRYIFELFYFRKKRDVKISI